MSRSTWSALLLTLAAALLIAPTTAAARPVKGASLKQVGYEPLMHRGMNAAIAVHGDYAYIGSRTDGGHEGMPHGGVNGLYVLEYKGRHARQIRGITFLEGNSNQGDALCFEPVGPAGRHCD